MSFKDFFKRSPEHYFEVGDLITCSCHGGLAIILQLYDVGHADAPSMNMAKIWWIRYPHEGVLEREWLHTIDRMRLHVTTSRTIKTAPKDFLD